MPPAGRPEKRIDATAGPLARLAGELRRFRGARTYRELSEVTGLSIATLRMAAAGERLPTWQVTRQFAAACGGGEDAVRELWEDACAAAGRPVPGGGLPPESDMPDPAAATTVEDFVGMLKRLRTWAGDPSLAELDKRAGGHGRLPRSTVSDMLRNQHRLPRLDLVLTFVRACGLDEDQAAVWERSWAMLRALEFIPGQPRPGEAQPRQALWMGRPRPRPAFRGLLVWMSGARPEILARCPTDRGTYTALGSTVLLAAALAALSAAYALHAATGLQLTAAGLAGLLWGGIIMSLDRTLVVSIHRGRGRRNLLAIVPRLLLGLILGAVISVPVVLQIFRPEINAQLVTLQQERAKQQSVLLENSPLAHEVKQLRSQISENQAILGGHLPVTVTSPQLQAAQAQAKSLEVKLQNDFHAEITARQTWQCQLTGQTCKGGSGVAGNGPIAQADYQEYQQALSTYNSTRSQLTLVQKVVNSAERSLSQTQAVVLSRDEAQAKAALSVLQAQYAAAEEDLQREIANANAANEADTGLLTRLTALGQAAGSNSVLMIIQVLFFVLFATVAFLPVIVRMVHISGPQNTYEKILRMQELADIRAASEYSGNQVKRGQGRKAMS
jgi:hypothetical protein